MPRAVDKALEMIGEWRVAFGEDSAYKHVHTVYSTLEVEGFIIPEVKLASASYIQKPPKFAETKSCFFCAKDFGAFTRRVSTHTHTHTHTHTCIPDLYSHTHMNAFTHIHTLTHIT